MRKASSENLRDDLNFKKKTKLICTKVSLHAFYTCQVPNMLMMLHGRYKENTVILKGKLWNLEIIKTSTNRKAAHLIPNIFIILQKTKGGKIFNLHQKSVS